MTTVARRDQPPQALAAEKMQLRGLGLEELRDFLRERGEAPYRAAQLFRRLYRGRDESFDDMTELPAALRQKLAAETEISTLALVKAQEASDGTKKMLFALSDGREIETVLIPSETVGASGEPKRRTLCVSSQVGCAVNCRFCATASLKMKRNLTAGEIFDQFAQAQKHSELPITNLVFMGMGEPMLNYDNVMKAVEIFTHPEAGAFSPRRITISTSGFADGIRRMADEGRSTKLALSLHAATNGLRTELMPINKKWDLQALGEALEYYYRKTRLPVTFEYILFEGLNDSERDAERLAKFARRFPSKINLIPFHPIDFVKPEGFAATLRPTTAAQFQTFAARLRALGSTVMVRSSSGKEIQAACGQLALAEAAPR